MDVDAIFGLIPASNDRLDMLKRALENGRSLDEDTCAYAAGHGDGDATTDVVGQDYASSRRITRDSLSPIISTTPSSRLVSLV